MERQNPAGGSAASSPAERGDSAARSLTVSLTGAPETMLATLYARALDSRAPDSVLHDHAAAEAVDRIDYDFARTGVFGPLATAIALRARQLDEWTAAFLVRHPEATVLHLACGLDTRAHRLAPAASVCWVDVDYPAVLELRERLLPVPAGDYRTIAASVTDDGWLDEVPADRPTVVVFEGLSMYLREGDGRRLVERVTSRFPSGELLFDCLGTVGVLLQPLVPLVRNAGATLHWAVDDPRCVETWAPGLELLDVVRSLELPGLDRLVLPARLGAWALSWLPFVRDVSRLLRYRF